MAFIPRRTALTAMVALGALGLQPLLAGPAAAAGLGAPTSLAPNSSSVAQKNPVLTWSDVSGASSYKVELSKSSDWSDNSELVDLPDNGKATTSSYAVPQTLVHGVYFWRVRALDSASNGPWSSNAQLDRAWTDAPSTTASNPTVNATAPQVGIATYPWRFAWTPIPNASSYEVELSIYPTFTQPGTTQSGNPNDGINTVECLTANTSWTPYAQNSPQTPDVGVDTCDLTSFDPAGDPVFWRVRGIDDSLTSQVASTSQANTLECYGTSNVEAGPPFPNPSIVTSTALGTPASPGQECSNWSATKSVPFPTSTDFGDGTGSIGTTGNVSGVTLGCLAGATADYDCLTMPEIHWQPVTHANQYVVTIADDASFTNVEHTYTTQFLSLTPRDELADYTAGKGYYVAVQACVVAGCTQASVKTFTKQTPKPTNLSATPVTNGVQLSWKDLASAFATTPAGTPTTEAENYQVQVTKATDTEFDNPVSSDKVDVACDPGTSVTCYAPPTTSGAGFAQTIVSPKKSGSYIWRVSPLDVSGNVLPAATDGSAFTIDVTRPSLKLTTHNGVSVNAPLTITASEPVSGVSAGTVHVVPAGKSASHAVAGTLTAAAGNSWTFKPKSALVTGETYELSVDAGVVDLANNPAVVAGSGVRTATKASDTSPAWKFSKGWHKHGASGARSGSYKSAKSGHTAKITVVGSVAKLYACKGPSMGKVKVTVAGKSKTVNEHNSFTECGAVVWQAPLPAGETTIKVRVSKHTGNVDELAVT